MTVLIKGDEEIRDQEKILDEQRKFYQDLYTSDPTCKFVCDEQNLPKLEDIERDSMEAPISLTELTNALKNTKRGKTPGSDGLIAAFYVMFWKKLGPLLHEACIAVFNKKELFHSAQQGIITTIPKKGKDTRFFKNFKTNLLAK